MTLQDLLDKACNGSSDNKTAQKLGITRSTFSAYRTGRKNPSDEVLEKIIQMTDLDPLQVYAAAYAEKVQNPTVAEAFRHLAA